MKSQEEVLKLLPLNLAEELREIFINNLAVQEIRIKANKPVIVNLSYKEIILGFVPSIDDLKQILVRISNYSLYAYEEEIRQGYITIKGGHRIGIAGECVLNKGEIKTIRNISSLNIRICHEVKGCSNEVMKYINKNDSILNTLIVSPPKCGKTTILRDMARNISNGMPLYNLKGKKVSVIDERSEIASCFNGIPQLDIGIRTDILDNCFKKDGMIMAIRSLSPEIIICDEIGTYGEIEALNMAFNSGVNIIVTIHGYSIDDVYKRTVFKELLENSILDRIIVLSSRKGPGTIENIYSIEESGDVKCLK
ncbi:stage III sporulation protein AA [Clostridium sartagoforme]|uniref:Stage III sporulation protein AA n=1 Tax=Clostridium sartagoforme TaxID=84031 RepID=A0A4S2DPJ7_9CLOT|nr:MULTISPECIES: stage III sporulation protein AA [Clostridium]MBS5938946.1 stage III sporulation protein AA [Clostridium sp.]TGY44348.1 stage III sporulation protein AA [Clostridium sartagoforme]